jgi:phosphatidylserine/phosphatidylglycerophosphate/cardiolipin synthase-like enzyme
MNIKIFARKIKKYWLEIILCLLVLFLVGFLSWNLAEKKFERDTQVIYSLDKKENDQEIIKLIDGANKYIYFAIFTFTKDNIADALVRAKGRGVLVWGITDLEQTNSNNKLIVEKLLSAKISIETQKHMDGIMHIKAIVTEKAYASGSYNWTESATSHNDEVLEIGVNKYLHDKYLAIIEKLLVTNQ